jgi:hypothetical protein
MICQQQFSVWVVLPTQGVEALDALGIACRREQLAGFFDGGGRGGPVTKPLAIPISAMSCLAGIALRVLIELLLAACRAEAIGLALVSTIQHQLAEPERVGDDGD